LRGHLGEVFEQHAVGEYVATADLLNENQPSALVEKPGKMEGRISS